MCIVDFITKVDYDVDIYCLVSRQYYSKHCFWNESSAKLVLITCLSCRFIICSVSLFCIIFDVCSKDKMLLLVVC